MWHFYESERAEEDRVVECVGYSQPVTSARVGGWKETIETSP
jgi:hypothetical protein